MSLIHFKKQLQSGVLASAPPDLSYEFSAVPSPVVGGALSCYITHDA